MYDFQRKHGHDIDCHVLAPASTCSNTRASTFVTTRASTCITTRASMVLNGASTCSNTCASTCNTTRASTCITTRASTCHYTCARLLFKNMLPGMAARVLYRNEVACSHPEECTRICGSTSGCSNIAYVKLVLDLMPTGVHQCIAMIFTIHNLVQEQGG